MIRVKNTKLDLRTYQFHERNEFLLYRVAGNFRKNYKDNQEVVFKNNEPTKHEINNLELREKLQTLLELMCTMNVPDDEGYDDCINMQNKIVQFNATGGVHGDDYPVWKPTEHKLSKSELKRMNDLWKKHSDEYFHKNNEFFIDNCKRIGFNYFI